MVTGCIIASSTLRHHLLMVMIFQVPIPVGDVVHVALLIGTLKSNMTVITQNNPRCSGLGSPEIPLLTSRDAAMAALLEMREVAPMTLDCHLPVSQKTFDIVEMRFLVLDVGDEQCPAQVPAHRVVSPLLPLRKGTCRSTCVPNDLIHLNHWGLAQGATMTIRIDLATGTIGTNISPLLALMALPGDIQDNRYLHQYLILVLLGQIGCNQVAQMTAFPLIMVIRWSICLGQVSLTRPLLLVGWAIPPLFISWALILGDPSAMRVRLILLSAKIGSPCC